MRLCLLIFACAVAFASACPSLEAQSPAKNGAPAAAVSKNLCTEGRILCVSTSLTDSLVNNPFRIDVQVNSTDDVGVAWQIRDSTGQILEVSSTNDYSDQPMQDFTVGRILHVQAFIFTPSRSQQGTVVLTPSRYTIQTGAVDLPGITIPVRLTTAKSTVRMLEPEDPEELRGAVSDAEDSSTLSKFDPKLKLVPHHVTVMRFAQDAIIGATAEAVLRSHGGQSQWHVMGWHQEGNTAHVKIAGSGWAGVSYYLTEVGYLIRKSVLNLPGIKSFVFDGRQ
jgi:hypothetical protein